MERMKNEPGRSCLLIVAKRRLLSVMNLMPRKVLFVTGRHFVLLSGETLCLYFPTPFSPLM